MFVSQQRDCSLELHLIWADSYTAIMMFLWFTFFFFFRLASESEAGRRWALETLTALTAEQVSQWVITLTRREETRRDSNGQRENKKKTGKEQGFKKPFIHSLKLRSVTEQLTRRVDYRLHQNAKIRLGTSALISIRDSVLHTLFPFAAFQKSSGQINSKS